MAQYNKLAYILNGLVQNVDLSVNDLAVDRLRVGSGGAGTYLSQAILDNLVSLQNGTDFSAGAGAHTHDGRYFTETELGSTSGSTGSDLIGDDNSYSNFTPAAATVKGALSGIDTALGALSTDTKEVKVSANDTTPGYLEEKIVSANSMLTIATLNDGGNEDLQLTIVNSAIDHGALAGLADDDHTQYHNDTRGDARYYQQSQFVTTATAHAPVKLDASGKIAVAQLPSAIMTYEGVWNASTNTPSLIDGSGDAGMVYRVSTAGSHDFGSGSISFSVGDYVIYNGANWEKSDTTDAVASVNGATGIVTVNAINELTGDVTTSAASGSESKAATIAANAVTTTKIADGNVTLAKLAADSVDENKLTTSVAGAGLTGGGGTALAVNVDNSTVEINSDAVRVKDAGITEAKLAASVAGDGLTGGAGSPLAVGAGTGISVAANAVSVDYAPMVKKAMTAGESMAANTSFLVRWAVNGETASRQYKATNAAAVADGKFYAVGVALKTSAVSAGDSVDVTCMGTHTLGSSDTPFNASDIGKPVYLGTGGAWTLTAPTGSGEAVYRIGMVEATDKIWVGDKQLNGVA